MDVIHIPDGINFDCTGCGNCCLAWPVPVTTTDYDRILGLQDPLLSDLGPHDFSAANPEEPTGLARSMLHIGPRRDLSRQGITNLFRPLNSPALKLKGFTHTLEKRADGKCEFLTEDNRCQLHVQYGPNMKPAMCQLFPYTFNKTPSGVYASVSFASTGTLLNSGQPLSRQVELIRQKWELFCQLFPALSLDWMNTQLIDGILINWDEYISIDRELLNLARAEALGRIDKRILAMSSYLTSNIAKEANNQRLPPLNARPKQIDQLLLQHLMSFYLPDDVFGDHPFDLDFRGLLKQLMEPPSVVHMFMEGKNYTFQQLKEFSMGELESESEDLLFRFVYCRLFVKLYFGAGFANLSVLAGIHHLGILIALIRLKIKMLLLSRKVTRLSFFEMIEIVRALERRLTQINLSRESITILEVLLTSPERLDRIFYLAA